MMPMKRLGFRAAVCGVACSLLVSACGSDEPAKKDEAEPMAVHSHAAPASAGSALRAEIRPSTPLEAGRDADLSIAFLRADGGVVDDFETTHEKRLHLFVVSDDLTFFDHVHPTASSASPGRWSITQPFPRAGTYHLYADFKSAKDGAQLVRSDLRVAGAPSEPVALVADTTPTDHVGGIAISANFVGAPLPMGDAMLTYTLADANGAPITDLEPYLGALGHLFILKDDRVTTVHAHPIETSGGGPTVTFHASLPSAGKYKLWAQFKRRGDVLTAPFTIEVSSAPSDPHAHHTMH